MKKLVLINLALLINLILAQIVIGQTLSIPGVTTGQSNNYFAVGTGDGGDLTTYNCFLRLHDGLAIGSPFVSNGSGGYVEKATISFHGRAGDINTIGKIFAKNGFSVANNIDIGSQSANAMDVMSGFTQGTETRLFVGQNHNFGASTGRYGIELSLKHVDGTALGKTGYLSIWSGNVQARVMAFDYLGNVGIGTSKPDARLTVKGTIHTQEVKVDLSVLGPDYVFETSYKLPSLEELNDYIKLNKHLPEVPSACAMEENGVKLGEMNMLLLKKVEELTLYNIQQNERIKIFEERLRRLEQRQP